MSLDNAATAWLLHHKDKSPCQITKLLSECKAVASRIDNTRYGNANENKLPHLRSLLATVRLQRIDKKLFVEFGKDYQISHFFQINPNFNMQLSVNNRLLSPYDADDDEHINDISDIAQCFTNENLTYLQERKPIEWFTHKKALCLLLYIIDQYLLNIGRGQFDTIPCEKPKRLKHSRHRTHRCASYVRRTPLRR